MTSSHRRVLAPWKSLLAAPAATVCLFLLALCSAQQLTAREIAFLRDSGLMRPEDVAASYDHQLSIEKVQRYRLAAMELMGAEDKKMVVGSSTFLSNGDAASDSSSKGQNSNGTAPLQLGGACPKDACQNMAICIPADRDSSQPYTCLCPDGYFGETCQYDVIECVRQPCLHDGDCRKDKESERGYKCLCPLGFSGVHCEFLSNITDAKGESNDVSVDPWFLSYIAIWCILILACGLSLVIAVEAERRLTFERYKLYTALGYAIPFPRLDFCRLIDHAVRRCVCCLGWCVPEDEAGFPEFDKPAVADTPDVVATQPESTAGGKASGHATKP